MTRTYVTRSPFYFTKSKKGSHRPPLQNVILYNNYQLLILQKSLQ